MAVLMHGLFFVFLGQSNEGRSSGPDRVPAILVMAFEQRLTINTAAFSVRRVWENRVVGRRVDNLEIRMAGTAEHWIEKGDDDGFLSRDLKTGQPRFGVRNMSFSREHLWDRGAGVHWKHWKSDEFFDLSSAATWDFYVDMRTVGLQETEIEGDTPILMRDRLGVPKGITYTETPMPGNIVVVNALEPLENPKGGYLESEWLIDKLKGPSIIQKTAWLSRPGEPQVLLSEVHVQLGQFDGRWWPVRSEIKSPAGGTSLLYEFTKVEFDHADHPQVLDVDYMRVPAGARVNNILNGAPIRERYVGQGRTVSEAEWSTIKDALDPTPLRHFKTAMRALGPGTFPAWWDTPDQSLGVDGLSDQPDQWEIYVRRWIMRHTTNHRWVVIEPLTDAQKAAAQSVLTDCRDKARPIRSRCDDQANSLRAEVVLLEKGIGGIASSKANHGGAASQSVQTESGNIKEKIGILRTRILELEKPREIATLFEELKTRLNGILTTKQRDPGNGSFQQPTVKTVRLPDGRIQYVHPQ